MEKEELIQQVVDILKNHPEDVMPSEICVDALNRICPHDLICRILISPKVENERAYGI